MTSITHAREIYEDGRMDGEARGLARGLAKGKIQSILELLGELGSVPELLQEKIYAEENPEILGRWVKLAARAESFADFEEKITAIH